MKTLPSSCAVWKFWEPQPPGALRACPDLLRKCLKVQVKAWMENHLTGEMTQHLLMPGDEYPNNHIVKLFQYGDHIYWTDWYRKSVEQADKITGKDRIVIWTVLDGVLYCIVLYCIVFIVRSSDPYKAG